MCVCVCGGKEGKGRERNGGKGLLGDGGVKRREVSEGGRGRDPPTRARPRVFSALWWMPNKIVYRKFLKRLYNRL